MSAQMGQAKALHIEEAPSKLAPPSNKSHKSVPRWLRMSLRSALLMGVVALPSLVVKDESFKGLNKYR